SFLSSRRRHTQFSRDWSSDVCSSDLSLPHTAEVLRRVQEAGRYGIETGPVSADFGKAIDLSRQAAQRLVKGVSFLMRKNGVHVVEGRGRRAGPDDRKGVV